MTRPIRRGSARLQRTGAPAAILIALLGACEAHGPDAGGHGAGGDATGKTETSGKSKAGRFQLSWTTSPSPVVVGELFTVDTTLRDAKGAAVAGAKVALDAYMPMHQHGMEGLAPDTVEVTATPGLYRTKGMRLQMPGQWELRWTLQAGAESDSAALSFAAD